MPKPTFAPGEWKSIEDALRVAEAHYAADAEGKSAREIDKLLNRMRRVHVLADRIHDYTANL
jgi:hypothetical protein